MRAIDVESLIGSAVDYSKVRSEAKDRLAAEKKTEKRRLMPEERRKIYLEEKVRAEARDKLAAEQKQAASEKKTKGCLLRLGLAILIVVGIEFCREPNVEYAAKLHCEGLVRTVLDSPSTADFPFPLFGSTAVPLYNNTYRITSYFDSKNVFGTTMRTECVCTIRFTGDLKNLTDEAIDRRRNWTLVDLEFGRPLPQ